MSDELLCVITLIAALGTGLVAGIFFAFSTFVMKALYRLPPVQGIAAMQSINVVVINPWFMTVFFGTAAACIILVILSLLGWDRPDAGYLLLGGTLYLFGTILVTIAYNVPRNEALAAVDPASADGASLWADYAKSWTTWNHVRTVAALAAAASLTVVLCF
jgi:uncharacterized membrane protein